MQHTHQLNPTIQSFVISPQNNRRIKNFIFDQTILQPQNISIKKSPSPIQAKIQTQYTCKICLQPCPNIQFCNCIKGMLSHQQCLIKYLENKDLTKPSLSACQICRKVYRLEFQNQCTISFSKSQSIILQNPYKCVVYGVFFLVTSVFYGFLGYALSNQQIQHQIFSIIIIVSVCISLLFIFFLVVWIFEFIIILKKKLIKIKQNNKKQRKKASDFIANRQYSNDTSFGDLIL